MSSIEALAQIISATVSKIQAGCTDRKVDFPSLDDPLTMESEGVKDSFAPEAHVIVAACNQLVATLMNPAMYTARLVLGVHTTAALTVIEAGHVPEILREAGPGGMHVNDISKKNGVDAVKLARLLRTLASQHLFVEVSPDVFANNRISSIIDTGKSLAEIQKSPDDKWDNAMGIGAAIGHCGDEAAKASSHLADLLLQEDQSLAQEPNGTALQHALGIKEPIWEWFEAPGNSRRLKRFGQTMKGHAMLMSPSAILQVFDWTSLPEGSIVVDVGGGIGTSALTLAENHKHLKYIVQDREPVIVEAKQIIAEKPRNGGELVKFQAQDFFQEQSVTDASVFLLRIVLHDWSDKYSEIILKNLRKAATATTKLVVVDTILDNACATADLYTDIPGAAPILAPPQLLPNFGSASLFSYLQDLQMMVLLNAGERTVGQFKDLFERCGWKLQSVSRLPPPNLPGLVAVPI